MWAITHPPCPSPTKPFAPPPSRPGLAARHGSRVRPSLSQRSPGLRSPCQRPHLSARSSGDSAGPTSQPSDPPPIGPGSGESPATLTAASKTAQAILRVLHQVDGRDLDGLLEHLPDEIIDQALAERKRRAQRPVPNKALTFDEVLDLDHNGATWRLDSFALRLLIFNRPIDVTLLSSLLVAPDRSLHCYEVRSATGEASRVTMTLALQDSLEPRFRSVSITQRWRLRSLTGEAADAEEEAGLTMAAVPDPRLGPEAVVGAQLQALQRRDAAGVFAFASPQNQSATGPLARFEELLQSAPYAPLMGHARCERLNRLQLSAVGYLEVVAVITSTATLGGTTIVSQPHLYVFELGLQAADSATAPGCWATHSVRLLTEMGPLLGL